MVRKIKSVLKKAAKKVHHKKGLDDIPGWFTVTDQVLMQWLLEWQNKTRPLGNLVELGVYLGKSAIHIGKFKRSSEKLFVCDLFDDAKNEKAIQAPTRKFYSTLKQQSFERNYLAFHKELPIVIKGLSSKIMEYADENTCRFIHIDASHLYHHVREDTFNVKKLIQDGGIVVFDDYRTKHTIGCAAAVWEAVLNDGFNPICLTEWKLYGTWGDPEAAKVEIINPAI